MRSSLRFGSLVLVILVVALLAGGIFGQQKEGATEAGGGVGRFRLFSPHIIDGGPFEAPILKIDTQIGRVWRLHQGKWFLLPEGSADDRRL